MIEDLRKLFQDLIVPQLESLRGDMRALEARLEGRINALDQKLGGQIYALDQKLDFKYEILVTKIDGLEAILFTLSCGASSQLNATYFFQASCKLHICGADPLVRIASG